MAGKSWIQGCSLNRLLQQAPEQPEVLEEQGQEVLKCRSKLQKQVVGKSTYRFPFRLCSVHLGAFVHTVSIVLSPITPNTVQLFHSPHCSVMDYVSIFQLDLQEMCSSYSSLYPGD